MKSGICFCTIALVLSLLPSCMSSSLATVAVAGAGAGVTDLPGISALLGKDAPQPAKLVGRSMDYSGEQRGMDNIGRPVSGSLLFGSTNPYVVRYVDGTSRSTLYTRQNRKKAIITITTPAGVENYRLSFEDGQQGTYTYERRHGANFATGEGQFTIR